MPNKVKNIVSLEFLRSMRTSKRKTSWAGTTHSWCTDDHRRFRLPVHRFYFRFLPLVEHNSPCYPSMSSGTPALATGTALRRTRDRLISVFSRLREDIAFDGQVATLWQSGFRICDKVYIDWTKRKSEWEWKSSAIGRTLLKEGNTTSRFADDQTRLGCWTA